MPVAAVPSLALIAGCAFGLLSPSFPAFPAETVAAAAVLAAIVSRFRRAGLVSGRRPIRHRRQATFLVSLACAFASGGALLAQHVWLAAWRPPLRAVFDDAVRREKADAAAAKRFVTEDTQIPMELTGVLRADASPTETGASMSVEVTQPAAGGVLLTVVGDAARAGAAAWRAGRTVRVTAQVRRPSRYLDPGVPDEERLLARRGTTLVGTVKSASLVDVVGRGSWLAESAAAVRAFVRRAVAEAVGRRGEQAGAIVTAIVIGDRTALDETVERQLQEAGTYHVIAISGGNIAILAGLTLLAFRLAGVLGRTAMLSAIGGLVAYGYLVGGGASVDRATLMAVIFFAGRAIDQRSPPFNTLAVVAGLLVASDPLTVADPAFVLTFGATAAILVTMPLVGAIDGLPGWLVPAVSMVAASAASETALLPVGAFVFSRVTFAGLGLNFFAIPLMAVAQVAGMALVPVAIVSTRAASLIGWIAYASARGLIWSASLVRFVPALTWRVAAPGWPVIVIYYAGLMLAFGGRFLWPETLMCAPLTPSVVARRPFSGVGRGAAVLAGLGVLCTASAACWLLFEPWSYFANRGDGRLHITFIDVGQGDSAFIRFPRGGSLLVDAGGVPGNFDIGDRVVAPVLRELGVRRVATLAFTHGDNDHIGGGPSLMREFRPDDVWEGVPMPAFPALRIRREVAAEVRARWTNVIDGNQSTIDGVRLVVRHPDAVDWERQKVRNEDSIVIELLWKDVSVVLMGDAGIETERVIAPQFAPSRLRVIKVGHHGSPTASSEAFIRTLAPRIAVVSVGRSNSFGHPNPVVLQRFRDEGAEIFRTDQEGAVSLATDGEVMQMETFTGRRERFDARVRR